MPQEFDDRVVFTVESKPKIVELDGYIGADANQAEAFALCERLIGAVRDFKPSRALIKQVGRGG